jgi:hypothetical protein
MVDHDVIEVAGGPMSRHGLLIIAVVLALIDAVTNVFDPDPNALTYVSYLVSLGTLVGAVVSWKGPVAWSDWLVIITRVLGALAAILAIIFAPVVVKIIAVIFVVVSIYVIVGLVRSRRNTVTAHQPG